MNKKGNSNIHLNKLYLGLIFDNKNINFYLVENKKYLLKFIIYYGNEETLKNEIETNIIPKGIEEYLYEMGINFSITDNIQSLYNIELKEVGSLHNKSKMNLDKIKPQYTRNLECFQCSYYYNAIIQCLANIGFLKDRFLNRKQLLKEKIIKNNRKITNIFYRIIQYIWYWKINSDEQKEKYLNFLYEIQSLSGINNIYDKLDLLIEFLLLAIHSEQNLQNKEENISYKLNDLQNEFNKKNNSFIKDLIYFELECKKCHNKINFNNYILYLNIKELMLFNKIKNNKGTNIENLLSLKQEIYCYNCKKMINSKKKFISYPKILIIIILDKEKDYIKFKLNEKLIIEKKKTEYELISLIKEFNKDNSEENKKVITYLKSPINNSWYKYEEQHSIESLSFDIIENDYSIPNLLIYKKIDK